MSDSNSPFFSFVTATYNRAAFLPTLVSCMSNQTFQEFEIIIVDDGSTDDTVEVLERLKTSEPRLRVIRQENKERGSARNNGIRQASGKYVVFADSDDTFEKDHLTELKKQIIRLDYPDFICNKFDIIKDGRTITSAINKLKEGWYDYRLLLEGNVIGMYHAIKRENPGLKLFEEDRSFAILEDWMFNFENLRNNRIYLTDRTTYHLHDHSSRSMRSNHQEIVQRKSKAVDWIISRIQLEDHEISKLRAHALYFSAVHMRIDGNYKAARKNMVDAIAIEGVRPKHLILFAKLLLGEKLTLFYRKLRKK